MNVAIDQRRNADEVLAAGEFPLTRKDLAEIAAMIYSDAGIFLNESKASLVYSRLSKHIRQLGLRNFREYCVLVASPAGAAPRKEMLSFLTTNFTRFFRENHHFEHLRDEVLPGLVTRLKAGGRARIWSAASSDGQEPYSIALTALQVMPNIADYDFKILATDIDPNVIAFGRAGLYDEATLEAVPKALKQRWFTPSAGEFEVSEPMRELVSFRELNLIGDWPMRGTFNAIFCRNVTIYFDQPTREKIWNRFCKYIEPDGWFFMGHSERLTGPAAKHLAYEGTTSYRRGKSIA